MTAERRKSACPSDETLASFAGGGLTQARSEAIEAHIDWCSECRRLLGQLSAFPGETEVGTLASAGAHDVLESREWGQGSSIAGRYTLHGRLGRGGMGMVWLARDERLRRRVAVKVLRSDMLGSEDIMVRFRREATAIANLRSTHIVEVYDYGIDGGSPYIVMELLEGEDLEAHLARERRMPLARIAAIVSQAANALTEAHGARIVHRDLKPANIFLCSRRGGELVKIIDFGVAKALGRDPTHDEVTTAQGVVVGTPRFMSPEQLSSSATVDHRADLWSLGVIAYFAFTGRPPFSGNMAQTVTAIMGKNPVPPSELVADCPPALDHFFARALAKDLHERFQTAATLAEALEDIARGGAGSPTVQPAVQPRRRRAVYVLAVLVAFGGAAAATARLWWRSSPHAHSGIASSVPTSAPVPSDATSSEAPEPSTKAPPLPERP